MGMNIAGSVGGKLKVEEERRRGRPGIWQKKEEELTQRTLGKSTEGTERGEQWAKVGGGDEDRKRNALTGRASVTGLSKKVI
jgi:hypothetical protein